MRVTWLNSITSAIPIVASKVRWTPNFTATGLTFTGSGSTHPCYNSYYVKIGDLVTFSIKINLSTVTNFGTGQYKTELPFAPAANTSGHYPGWCWLNPSLPADDLNGHIILQADHLNSDQTLDIHWLKETTATPKPVIESLFQQGNPLTLTTSSLIYINGTYISA